MFEIQVIPAVLCFFAGAIVGISAILLFNKMRTGSASAGKIKQEMEDYQGEVEAHFEETSKKFKDMAAQYQDLYQHLSVGATTLCRPENSILGLSDKRDPLAMAPTIEHKAKSVDPIQEAKEAVEKRNEGLQSSTQKTTSDTLNKQPQQKKQAAPDQSGAKQAEVKQAEVKQGEKSKDSSRAKKPD